MSAPALIRLTHISLATMALIVFCVHFYFQFFQSKRIIKSNSAFLLLIGFLIYQFFLQFVFLFYDSEYEGNNSAGLVRYSATYLFAWACIAFFETFKVLVISKWTDKILLPLLLISLFFGNLPQEFRSGQSNPVRALQRAAIDKIANSSEIQINGPNTRTYVVAQDSWGFESLSFRLSNLPNETNRNCWSFFLLNSENNQWACQKNLSKELVGYDYLLLIGSAQELRRGYSALFEGLPSKGSSQLYKVKLRAKEIILLETQPILE
jgi:hypothetical protein